tara:strand:- start:370 stop:1041 length:672 start_codon:yes stop_codon:yes gene_type:complete
MSEIRVNNIIADNGLDAVNFAKGINVSSGIITATSFSGSGANLTTLPAANITGTLPAISGANLTGIDGGISDYDIWYVTATVQHNQSPIVNNWSRWTRYGSTGSVTFAAPSSGIWTFPSTGHWLIEFTAYTYKDNGNERGCNTDIYVTTDNTSYSFAHQASTNVHNSGNQSKGHVTASYILDVTNTSTHKIKLYQGYQASGSYLMGHGSYLYTNVRFFKLRET